MEVEFEDAVRARLEGQRPLARRPTLVALVYVSKLLRNGGSTLFKARNLSSVCVSKQTEGGCNNNHLLKGRIRSWNCLRRSTREDPSRQVQGKGGVGEESWEENCFGEQRGYHWPSQEPGHGHSSSASELRGER